MDSSTEEGDVMKLSVPETTRVGNTAYCGFSGAICWATRGQNWLNTGELEYDLVKLSQHQELVMDRFLQCWVDVEVLLVDQCNPCSQSWWRAEPEADSE